MKIGVSSYSFFQYLRSGKLDLLSVIQKAADMGFEGIEYTDLPGDTFEERKALAEQIKAEAAKCGIELTAYVVSGGLLCDTQEEQDAVIARIKTNLDLAAVLGVKLFRYDPIYKMPHLMSYDEAVRRIAPAMRQIAEYGEKLGIMTMSENHGLIFQDYDRVEKLYDAINHPNYSLLIDIGNFLCADVDNVMCVSRLAHLASHVHLKDFIKVGFHEDHEGCFATRACNYLKGVAVGDGDAQTAQCLAILEKAGFDGYADIEYEGHEDCIEGLAKGIAYFKSLYQ